MAKSLAEELLGSKWKIRILKEIINEREINISSLVKRTNSFFKSVVEYLNLLEKLGIVKEKRFGKVRIIIANPRSEMFSLIERLIEKIEKEQGNFISD